MNEEQVERHIGAAVAELKHGETNIWRAGYHAHKLLGTYKKYGISGIAKASKKSVSSITNYANAYNMWLDVVRFTDSCEPARLLRRDLTPSHFWRMWEKRNSYNLSIRKCTEYLFLASTHGWSGEEMIEELITEMGRKTSPKALQTLYKVVYNICADLMTAYSGGAMLETSKLEWVREGMELFQDFVLRNDSETTAVEAKCQN